MIVKDENYYTVFGWMLNRLRLKGNDLKIYALIYSFSQDGESEYKGSVNYLTEFTGTSNATVKRSLARLEEIGYIEKTERNTATGGTNTFKAVPLDVVFMLTEGVAQNDLPPSSERPTPVAQNDLPPSSKRATIIIGDSNSSNNNSLNKERKKEVLEESINNGLVDFSQMSDEELLAYGERFSDGVSMEGCDWEAWFAYDAERKKRGAARKTDGWKGKVIVNDTGRIERLKSYAEIISEWGFSKAVVSALNEFVQHCLLNKQRLTNEKLNDICFRLTDLGDDDMRLDQLKRAIKFGYFDIAYEGMIEMDRRLRRNRREDD